MASCLAAMKKTRVVSLCAVIVFIRSCRELFFGAILSRRSKKTEEVQLKAGNRRRGAHLEPRWCPIRMHEELVVLQ